MQAMSELNEMTCEEFSNVAAELALGVLTGRERARALAHLDRCDACRDEVRQLTQTGEELLGLLPTAEPPAGFESRVLARIGLEAPAPAKKSRGWKLGRWPTARPASVTRKMLATAAVVAALAVAVLGGWGLRTATAPGASASSPLSSAALTSANHLTTGEIYVYNGTTRWLYMGVTTYAPNGTVICQVVGKDGHVTTVGSFRVKNGYGSWGSPVPAGTGQLAGARLISTNGAVLATASFSAT
jgi:hypothetical protein